MSEVNERSRMDEAVSVALSAWYDPAWDYPPEAMRAALLAALPVLLGEAAGFVAQDSLDELHAGKCAAVMFGTYSDRHGRTLPVYAPSLGEGHE